MVTPEDIFYKMRTRPIFFSNANDFKSFVDLVRFQYEHHFWDYSPDWSWSRNKPCIGINTANDNITHVKKSDATGWIYWEDVVDVFLWDANISVYDLI